MHTAAASPDGRSAFCSQFSTRRSPHIARHGNRSRRRTIARRHAARYPRSRFYLSQFMTTRPPPALATDRLTRFADVVGGLIPDALSTSIALLVLVGVQRWRWAARGRDAGAYYRGLWMLLPFTMQMTLILVLSSSLGATPFFKRAIRRLSRLPGTTAGVLAVSIILTAALSYFYWGLGLALGPLIAVYFAREAEKKGLPVDFPFLLATTGAAMAVWQFGFSASAPLLMNTPGPLPGDDHRPDAAPHDDFRAGGAPVRGRVSRRAVRDGPALLHPRIPACSRSSPTPGDSARRPPPPAPPARRRSPGPSTFSERIEGHPLPAWCWPRCWPAGSSTTSASRTAGSNSTRSTHPAAALPGVPPERPRLLEHPPRRRRGGLAGGRALSPLCRRGGGDPVHDGRRHAGRVLRARSRTSSPSRS